MIRFVVATFILLWAAVSVIGQELRVKEGVSLNLREGPGTSYPVIAKLNPGTTMMRFGQSSDDPEWLYVGNIDGVEAGWLHSDFVTWVNPMDWSHNSPSVALSTRIPPYQVIIGDSSARVVVNESKTLVASYTSRRKSIQIWNFTTGELIRNINFTHEYMEDGIFFLKDDVLAMRILRNDGSFGTVLINLHNEKEIYNGKIPFFSPMKPANGLGDGRLVGVGGKGIYIYDPDDYGRDSLGSFRWYKEQLNVKDARFLSLHHSEAPSSLSWAVSSQDGRKRVVSQGVTGDRLEESASISSEYVIYGVNYSQRRIYAAKGYADEILEIGFDSGRVENRIPAECPLGCRFSPKGSFASEIENVDQDVPNSISFKSHDSFEAKNFSIDRYFIEEIEYLDARAC